MAALRRLVFAALGAGLLAGLFAAAAHQIGTVPLIMRAESFEKPSEHATTAEHQHDSAWEPKNGVERTAYTVLADALAGTGFALLLGAGLTLRAKEIGWREGFLWGLAGFVTFTLAPGLGLPPQLPGSESAPLWDRQLWWLATAAVTGSALALIAFTSRARWAMLATVLIVLPHLYGAPEPAEHSEVVPATLTHHFAVAVTVVNFLFWGILGSATGYFLDRLRPQLTKAAARAAV